MNFINNKLRDKIGNINKNNGWHEVKHEKYKYMLLIASEILEAFEDYRDGKNIDEVWYEYVDDAGEKSISRSKFYSMKEGKKLGKPCGIPSEIADIVIRCLDTAFIFGFSIDGFKYEVEEPKKEFESYLFDMLSLSTEIYKTFDTFSSSDEIYHMIDSLNMIMLKCLEISSVYELDLEKIINEKLEYNKTRGYKHGGKKL